MKKGYQTITLDDDSYQFYFNTSTGKAEYGYNSKIKKFVATGLVIKPDDDDANYIAVSAALDDDLGIKAGVFGTDGAKTYSYDKIGTSKKDQAYVMINKSGSIVKNKSKLKDENDRYYVVNKNGVVVLKFASEEAYDQYFKDNKDVSASKLASGSAITA